MQGADRVGLGTIDWASYRRDAPFAPTQRDLRTAVMGGGRCLGHATPSLSGPKCRVQADMVHLGQLGLSAPNLQPHPRHLNPRNRRSGASLHPTSREVEAAVLAGAVEIADQEVGSASAHGGPGANPPGGHRPRPAACATRGAASLTPCRARYGGLPAAPIRAFTFPPRVG